MLTEPRELLLGYDVRVWPPVSDWAAERRRTYALRDQVEGYCSVDRAVWPSRVSAAVGPGLTSQGWADSAGLAEVMPSAPGEGWVRVAMTLFLDLRDDESGFWQVLPEPTEWNPSGTEWSCLGYDIADAGLVSGLSNCGYSQAEKESLGASWASAINKLHLFEAPSRADSYTETTAQRVREHAPFYVFGLHACSADLSAVDASG